MPGMARNVLASTSGVIVRGRDADTALAARLYPTPRWLLAGERRHVEQQAGELEVEILEINSQLPSSNAQTHPLGGWELEVGS